MSARNRAAAIDTGGRRLARAGARTRSRARAPQASLALDRERLAARAIDCGVEADRLPQSTSGISSDSLKSMTESTLLSIWTKRSVFFAGIACLNFRRNDLRSLMRSAW